MNYKKIDEIDIAELEIYHQLREGAFRSDNSFIADSPKVVNKLLEGEIEVKSILATQEYYDEFESLLYSKNIPKLYIASKSEMQKIVGHKIHHNCMMHGVRPSESRLEELDENIIMLDAITSTENVGSIARSAAALGIGSYMLPKESPHPFSRRALRVSMGHASLLKINIYDDIAKSISELKAEGYKIFAAEISENSTMLRDVVSPKKWVLIMGHEGKGISQDILSLCDEVVTIEMQEGVKSLNVSVAASIIMYQFKRCLSV
ncbi:MAG: RNA methyltransferase [Campylobacterota bacterium]|nr:RNA methyltransferase [Campylobacterota bacterium]